MALKLDMSKAFDRVEWDFLFFMMARMGFNAQWISRLRTCVTSVTFSIIINREIRGCIHPTRGLCQGDPLSRFLFLICIEGLSHLIHQSIRSSSLHGIRISSRGPIISHLLFADDSLLFCRADLVEGRRLLDILHLYERMSGQFLNVNKSSVTFSSNVREELRVSIKNLLCMNDARTDSKYLGLPTLVTSNRRELLSFIKERIWGKLQGWNEKLLSQAGRAILIKAVIQAISTYAMSIFRFPKILCEEINRLSRNFFWSGKTDVRKMHWIG
ncbi:uncharacterized protein LOC120012571 [Tripterygium wilfordii]|uniref:uncharacterized protein LOC120012571 n=1 Tax=Tripterygium wilfordii TaxID=458696 RepID=UPI0018F82670|nr:uncharacterized protein LOC120012571 [Tripterygium wilfordii]